MSNVYVVTSGQYSDYRIEAVFSDGDLANEYIQMREKLNQWIEDYGIEEYTINEYSARETVGAAVSDKGDVRFYIDPHEKEKRREYTNGFDVFVNIHYNDDKSIMEKSARDRAAMIRAREEGI